MFLKEKNALENEYEETTGNYGQEIKQVLEGDDSCSALPAPFPDFG